MLTILGSHDRMHGRTSRRRLLQAGGMGLLGAGLSGIGQLAGLNSTPAEAAVGGGFRKPGFGKAKKIIVLYLYGAASQFETFDPKPLASEEIRGPFRAIDTSIPGVQVSEHLPRIAKNLHRITVVRSMNHPQAIHNVALAVTGIARTDVAQELNQRDARHWPFFGSAMTYLEDVEKAKQPKGPPQLIPRNVILPWRQSRYGTENRAGFFGGFLGAKYDPTAIEFKGIGTKKETVVAFDPYVQIDPKEIFNFPSTTLPAGVTLDRFNSRRSLLEQFDAQKRSLLDSPQAGDQVSVQKMAMQLCDSKNIPDAISLEKEPAKLRENYGYHLFGQSALMARRMLEAGSHVATVIWDEFKQNNSAWDTHAEQTRRLKDELCPGFDQAYVALLDDLEARGLLDETLVVVLTDHGRTPKSQGTDGRDHWSGVYSIALAGAGIAKGKIVGESDKMGAFVKDRPISPKDIQHTIYHLAGIDSTTTTIPDRNNRPIHLVDGGTLVPEVLG